MGRFTRVEGRVERVLERRMTQLLGIYRQGRSGTYLVPQDPRTLYTVTLTGPPDAATDGDLVLATITGYPESYRDIEARVETVLGPASDPRVEVDALILQHGLPQTFPDTVLAEAARVPTTVAADGPSTLPAASTKRRPWHQSETLATRLDLRALPLITIDGESARDFDDAVCVLEGPDGHVRLLVAIADVAAYVPRGSALDEEARARGTSVLPRSVQSAGREARRGVDGRVHRARAGAHAGSLPRL